ncbi:MAG TPA: uracil-DNA glycosylase family protein [Gemmatimonadaceae bacterium]|nr:uracil-DNA glycosylase family protein [Gemmatimonadaceae bacterium]
MDAREQLRRYLEQRREMGERELVLDGLTVEEALRIVTGSSRAPTGEAIAPATGVEPPSDVPADLDWRSALRATGAAPSEPKHGKNSPQPPAQSATPRPIEPSSLRALEPSSRPPALESIPAGISVGSAAAELFGGPLSALDSLEKLAAHVASCTRCPLYSTATNPVPGEGNPSAGLMCVGEAPGATEDETGRPFVGAAGQLLTKILAAIDLRREDVFICNVLKHRPPGNRNPRPEEVAACSPYLIRQIELIRPKVILALGTFAAQTLLDTKLSIGKLRGQVHRYYGVPLVVTYHPAALLRNPGWKRPTWDDVKLARRILDSADSGA